MLALAAAFEKSHRRMDARVLVVDDHPDTVMLFVEELCAAGYDAVGATNPNEALNIAIVTKPDVIILDIAMPEMDGYELARLVRSYASTRGIRLIAISAHPFDFSAGRVPPGGWNAYVSKPVDPGTLPSLVRTVLSMAITSVNKTGPVAIPTPPSSKRGQNGNGNGAH
jgi:CheY-like chemotaxis protein